MLANTPGPFAPWPPKARKPVKPVKPVKPATPAKRIAPATDARLIRADGERFVDRLARRVRDLLIMGVVGPAMGVCAIVAIHYTAARHVPAPAPVHPAYQPIGNLPPAVAPLVADIPPLPPEPPPPTTADFGAIRPTEAARKMADWVVARHDNGRMPFVVLDKHEARLYVFQPDGVLVEDTAVLLGSARGDDTFPGIGNVPIKDVKPFQRTTAAGRFVTQPGLDIDRKDVVWLDYDAALAMHRVIDKVKSERRPQRLASPTPTDNRISYGCINIPIDFFDRRISPVFGKRPGVAYVIPEVKTFAQVFEHGDAAGPSVATVTSAKAPSDIAAR